MTCRTPRCTNDEVAHGLCRRCYDTARTGQLPRICQAIGCTEHVHSLAKRSYCPQHLQAIPKPRKPKRVLGPDEVVTGAKLHAEQVRTMRREYAEGAMLKTLADRYGVSLPMVSLVVRGEKYDHIPATEEAPWTKGVVGGGPTRVRIAP